MKSGVVTLIYGKAFKELAEITVPTIKAYAQRIGAEPIAISPPEGSWEQHYPKNSPAWLKLNLANYIEKFDRVMFVDIDCLISPKCPNLFEIVPETHLGAFMEGMITDRLGSFAAAMDFWYPNLVIKKAYKNEYFNSGVMVLSKAHRTVFQMPEKITDNFNEQGYLNAQAFVNGVPIHHLDFRFNRMSLTDQTGEDRHGSYVVHWAGRDTKTELEKIKAEMQDCIQAWKEERLVKTRIHIKCSGGLGDNVCQEPCIRYLSQEVYKDRKDIEILVTIGKDRAPILRSLNSYDNIKLGFSEETTKGHPLDDIEFREKGKPYCEIVAHPRLFDRTVGQVPPYFQTHNNDWHAYAILGKMLPPEWKRYKLATTTEDYSELEGLKPGKDENGKYIAVHPGTGWPSKTFPVKWWEEVIERLIESGRTPVLFGKDCGQVDEWNHGTLKLKYPTGAIDLRNKLTVGGMMALIERCPALLTNDSAPVHIAGAFDNWIFFASTVKPDELVLPYRHGASSEGQPDDWRPIRYWKVEVLKASGPRPWEDGKACDPTRMTQYPYWLTPKPVENYLPTPEEAVKTITENWK